jgi:hypothetical protein
MAEHPMAALFVRIPGITKGQKVLRTMALSGIDLTAGSALENKGKKSEVNWDQLGKMMNTRRKSSRRGFPEGEVKPPKRLNILA